MGASANRHERIVNRFCFILASVVICLPGALARAADDGVDIVPSAVPPTVSGLSLVLAGVVLLALEAHLFTFGALGALGVTALSAGLLLWYRAGGVSLEFVIACIAFFVLLAGALTVVGFRTRKTKFGHGVDSLIGRNGTVMEMKNGGGMVSVQGELWAFEMPGLTLNVGDKVEVINQKNLVLVVKKSL